MIPGAQHHQVIVIGAGPSGLMMAAQLLRNGVQPIIIDSRQGPTNQSKALAVQARSVEIYRQLGIADAIVKGAKHAQGLQFHQSGNIAASLPLSDVGEYDTPFPYVYLYQQSKNERVLLDYLTQNCCPVYWNSTLVDIKHQHDKVTVAIGNNNETQTLTCNWLIGADGAHSVVRKTLQIPFTGDTYEHQFYLADVTLESNLGDYLNMHLSANGFAAFFPMPEENSYRIVGNLPNKHDNNQDLTLDSILPVLTRITKLDLRIKQCNWFTTYRLHHRMAEKFGEGRCFLVGDAAHIHSPIGGQGMNTGLQDAYNLAWKLAGVIKEQLATSVLESYGIERMPVARQLLKTTDRAFNLIMSDSLFARSVKKLVLPSILKLAWKSDKIRQRMFIGLSQTGINYRNSKINLHLSESGNIKAGDRLPYLKIFDEKKQVETDLHEWCSKPGFTLIAIGKLEEINLFAIAKWITQKYNGQFNFFYLPPSSKNLKVFEAFGIVENGKKALIVRPDLHIGYMNDVVDIDMMENYLQKVLGFKHN
jgi:2-polyprenyl-6-methoxyphenol hydroxylase-like FAD-dependent oxidoreductase